MGPAQVPRDPVLDPFFRARPEVGPGRLVLWRKVETHPNLDVPAEIQRLQGDALEPHLRRDHAEKAGEGHLQEPARSGAPGERPLQSAVAEVKHALEALDLAFREVELFSLEDDPGMEPVERVHHEAETVGDAFVLGLRGHLRFVDPVDVAADQAVPTVSFLEIPSHPHVLVGEREDRFRDAPARGIEALFDDPPWVDPVVSIRDLGHADPILSAPPSAPRAF